MNRDSFEGLKSLARAKLPETFLRNVIRASWRDFERASDREANTCTIEPYETSEKCNDPACTVRDWTGRPYEHAHRKVRADAIACPFCKAAVRVVEWWAHTCPQEEFGPRTGAPERRASYETFHVVTYEVVNGEAHPFPLPIRCY